MSGFPRESVSQAGLAPLPVTGPTTTPAASVLVDCDSTSGAYTVTLGTPGSSDIAEQVVILTAGANVVTIAGSINGGTAPGILTAIGDRYRFLWDGSAATWRVAGVSLAPWVYNTSGNWPAPAGVTSVAGRSTNGGGGGGGGGSAATGSTTQQAPGTGGTAGQTADGVLAVTPGETLAIAVGASAAGGVGGAAGGNAGSSGYSGTRSSVSRGSTVILGISEGAYPGQPSAANSSAPENGGIFGENNATNAAGYALPPGSAGFGPTGYPTGAGTVAGSTGGFSNATSTLGGLGGTAATGWPTTYLPQPSSGGSATANGQPGTSATWPGCGGAGGGGGAGGINPPAAPTIAQVGTVGATAYDYVVAALTATGSTQASAVGSTSTGNATLSATDYNTITWTAVADATGYVVYGRSGTALTELGSTTTALTLDDTGQALGTAAAPTANTTAGAGGAGGAGGSGQVTLRMVA